MATLGGFCALMSCASLSSVERALGRIVALSKSNRTSPGSDTSVPLSVCVALSSLLSVSTWVSDDAPVCPAARLLAAQLAAVRRERRTSPANLMLLSFF
jgi:hypothetical protein